ncbi:hypothetical protein OK016_20495 [Vibrio chagasii]|nr:hypothetical protein [Vibrio chagasii]
MRIPMEHYKQATVRSMLFLQRSISGLISMLILTDNRAPYQTVMTWMLTGMMTTVLR